MFFSKSGETLNYTNACLIKNIKTNKKNKNKKQTIKMLFLYQKKASKTNETLNKTKDYLIYFVKKHKKQIFCAQPYF